MRHLRYDHRDVKKPGDLYRHINPSLGRYGEFAIYLGGNVVMLRNSGESLDTSFYSLETKLWSDDNRD